MAQLSSFPLAYVPLDNLKMLNGEQLVFPPGHWPVLRVIVTDSHLVLELQDQLEKK